jgi:hypothetical protein
MNLDFLNVPDITSDAFSQAFSFLLGRLESILDRRRLGSLSEDDAVESPSILEGSWRPTEPNMNVVEQKAPLLNELVAALDFYRRHPEQVNKDDPELRANLARLRDTLESIYGQHITFQGESRPRSGISVNQRAHDIDGGRMVGIQGRVKPDAHVIQEANDIRRGGSMIGITERDERQ